MRKHYGVLTSILLAVALFSTGFAASSQPVVAPSTMPGQADDSVTVDTARPVTEVLNEKTAYLATVSPDGNYIAWGKQTGRGRDRTSQLCVFEFETAGTQCSDVSPDVYEGYPYQFQWSPDSRYISFTENPITMGSESDIWLFDREAGSFTNLMDDGLVGSWSFLRSEGATTKLDMLPMWSPTGDHIYFWRIVPLGNLRFTIDIYRIAAEGGEAERVRDLTAYFADQAPLFDNEEIFLDGISSIAPDGSTLATIMTGFDEMGATQTSIWTIDLADENADPQELATMEDFARPLPEWALDFPPQVQGLAWTADGAGIVFVTNSSVSTSMPFQVYQYIDVASGEITPVVDFSGIAEMEDYMAPAPGSELPWRAYSPWTGSLSPAGDKLLMINDLSGTVALFTSPLPPTGNLPAVSASDDESPMSGTAISSRGEGGKVLAYDLLLTITEE